MLMTLWCTSDCLYLRSDGLLVPKRFFVAAWTHDILYKVEGGFVLKEALAAFGLDPDWLQIVATSGEFQVFGGIFLCWTYIGNSG
jgi:hypothetical protein